MQPGHSAAARSFAKGMCPHCHYWHSPEPVMKRICPDTGHWTQEERDLIHARAVRLGTPMAMSTEEFARRFGGR